jgi:repressor LexA
MSHPLPARQQAVLEAIQVFWQEHGVAPSLSDVARVLGVRRQTVHEHFRALQRKGLLDNLEGTARSWRPTTSPRRAPNRVPIVGQVAAGLPIFAEENIEGWITVDNARSSDTLFALHVHGDSMIGAGILEGDLVVVRQQQDANDGDIVVVLVDDMFIVKKFQRQGDQLELLAMNPAHPSHTVAGERVRIQGRVIGVRRDLRAADAS